MLHRRRHVPLAKNFGSRRATARMGVVMLAGLLSCQAHGNAERVEILNAIAPSATCEWLPNNDPVATGYYDPSIDNAQGYLLGLNVRNNMQVYTDDAIAFGEVANIGGTSHDVQLVGAEGCWYLADGSGLPDNAYKSGTHEVDCSKIPNQSGSFAISGGAGEGAGQAAAVLRVMTLPHMQSLFGAAFSPNDIPPRGAFVSSNPADNPSVAGINQTTSTVLAYDFGPPSPYSTASRNAAWGNFPADYTAHVIVQLRLRAQLQDNTSFVTNYVSYPIAICPRCLQNMCGSLVQLSCAKGPCGDGTPCLSNGTCADSTLTCSALTLFSGKVPDFRTNTCLPAQNFGSTSVPTCNVTGCPITQ